MIKAKSVLVLLACFSLSLNAQTKTGFNFKEADSLLQVHQNKSQLDSLAIILHNISTAYYNELADYDNAIVYALKEVEIGDKHLLKTSVYKKSLTNLGVFYYKNNQYNKSIATYKKVIDSFETNYRTYIAYCEIGKNRNELGDYTQAIINYKKGLETPSALSPKTLFNKYINFAKVYENIGTKESLKEKLILLQKADSIFTTNNLGKVKFYLLHSHFGILYKNELTYDFTKSKYHENLTLKKALKHKDTTWLITTYNNLGLLYNIEKKDSALYYFDQVQKLITPKSRTYSKLQNNFAVYYYNKNNTKKALEYLHYGLQDALPITIDSSYRHVPSIKTLSLSNQKIQILYTLISKAKYILNDSVTKKDNNLVKTGLQNILMADQLSDIIKQESIETKSKLHWQKEASQLYMLGVKASYLLNDHEQALYFIEKNKAILLLENINEIVLKKQLKLPLEILEEELLLKKKIAHLESRLNSLNTDSIQKNYYNLKIKYANFIETLRKDYPEYYNYKKPLKLSTLKNIQDKIDNKTVVIEYILNKENGYLLTITKEKNAIYRLDSITNLHKTIKDYLTLISNPLNTKEELNTYTTTSNLLYNILFPLALRNSLKNKSKLLIIPDYTLQNLPFESLKNDLGNYLIQDFETSYLYSYSFYEKNRAINRNAKNQFAGFAPKTFDYENLQNLPRSTFEVETIKTLLNGTNFIDEVATKANFLDKITDYKIIHLATHANANDSISPWIAFKNKKLYLNELYTTKSEAELVVLSACNSSLGQINAGEGVFSLARGFFYSGANSVISSLWNVNDKSTQEITTSFYKYLKKGKNKSESLRQAKLDYLNTHNLSEASPYYWSSLILIGDDSAIQLTNNSLYYIILGFLLLIILFFIIKKLKTVGNKS